MGPQAGWILALADDLTGALETGAKFASRGLAARVTTRLAPGYLPPHPLLVRRAKFFLPH